MKLLIVEDEPSGAKILSHAAEVSGYTEVEIAESGEEALGRVVQGSFDLITLDILLPGISGLEIVSVMRHLCPHAIIAIISAHVPEEVPSEVLECADTVIRKPIDVKIFKALLSIADRVRQNLDALHELKSPA